VGKYAVIGGLAAIQFIHIGDHAMISGGSLYEKMFHHLQKQQRAFVLCWNKFWFKKTRFYN
jgi:acyl-[acyl carrier protein]--UDP-N-acetylglucosamine O-acyltransferase